MKGQSDGTSAFSDMSVPASKIPSLIEYLADQGIDGSSLLEKMPEYKAAMREGSGFISLKLWMDINKRARDALNDPDFGLRYGVFFRGMPTVLGFLLRSCRDTGEALDKYSRYQRIEHHAWSLGIKREGGLVSVDFVPSCAEALDRLIVDFAFASLMGMYERLTGTFLTPLSVQLPYSKPSSILVHKTVFRIIPEFGCAKGSIVLSGKVLDLPIRDANAEVCERLESPLEHKLLALKKDETVAMRVMGFLFRHPLGEQTDIASVASKMGIGVRNLQLKLKAEGTAFTALRDSALKELALECLSEPTLSIQEISYRLGFADPSAFHRSFSRWTGTTPSLMRSRLAETKVK